MTLIEVNDAKAALLMVSTGRAPLALAKMPGHEVLFAGKTPKP